MLYAKVIYTGVSDYVSATDSQSVICADRFDFNVRDGCATMTIHRGSAIELMELSGDVWVMNESGKTISQFAVPFSHLTKDCEGQADARVSAVAPSVKARKHQ